MIVIVHIEDNAPVGWITGSDVHDLRRNLPAGYEELAEKLYRLEFTPRPGKHDLGGGFWLLA